MIRMRLVGHLLPAILLGSLPHATLGFTPSQHLLNVNSQHVFRAPTHSADRADASDIPARFPNLATRLERTNPTDDLFCGREGDKFASGFARFTNSEGDEDKHTFWWLFKARKNADNAPLVVVFGGGPGTTGMTSPILGEGPCAIGEDEDGNTIFTEAPYSWTDGVNLLAIDHPVGVGFSYGPIDSLRSTSEEAAWDLDDLLQAFWREYPQLAKNQFLVHSGSYGGTYIPNLINVIRARNIAAASIADQLRVQKMPDAIMMSNVWSDPATHYRHYVQSECDDLGFFNRTSCQTIARDIPDCLDAIQLAYEQPSAKNKREALEICYSASHAELQLPDRDISDNRCKIQDCFLKEILKLDKVLNTIEVKEALGVSASFNYSVNHGYEVILPRFMKVGDEFQPAYRLLGPAIEDGLRVLVYNGDNDGICPRRSNLAWMGLLQSKYQEEFRSAPEIDWPGVGWFKQAGTGGEARAGNYSFVSVLNSGHGPFKDQPEATRDLLFKWIEDKPFL